jgi:predicted DNA-binding transcriptional regulator AlpA
MAPRLIKAETVRELCGGVSDMTIWRWMADPALNFPKPIKVRIRRYWRESEVYAWLGRQTVEPHHPRSTCTR